MKYLLSSLLLLFCLSVNSQEPAERFRNIENWDFSTNGIRWGNDMQGLKITRQSRSSSDRGPVMQLGAINRDTLWFDLQYSIPLPQDSIFLSFDFKNHKLETLALRLYFYGGKERFIDSLVFQLHPEGHNRISFNNPAGSELVDVTLHGQRGALGRDTVSFQMLDARIEAKNHDLGEWFRSFNFDLNIESLYPLKKITGLDELKNKKIIGLGESVHGSQNLWREKAGIVRKLLSDKSIKLFCYEAGVDQCLNWDLYVRGIHPYSYRDVIFEDMKSFADNEDLIALLDEIRKENATRKDADKIRIIGLDLRSDKKYFYHYFLAYQKLNPDRQFLSQLMLEMSPLRYDNLIYKISLAQNPPVQLDTTASIRFRNLADIILSEKRIKPVIQEKDLGFLLDILGLEVSTLKDNEYRDIDRDLYMWEIFRKALLHYASGKTDRAIICVHSLHLCRTGHERRSVNDLTKDAKSMGSYIAENYPDDFWSISFQIGRGVIRTVEYKFLDIGNTATLEGVGWLEQPIWGSFERAARNVSFDNFYCKSSDLPGDSYTYRMVGNQLSKNQFFALSKDRFDAYVYLDYSTRYSPKPLHSYVDVSYLLDSLKLQNIPYSNTCMSDIDNVGLTIPENFRYKNLKSHHVNPDHIFPIEDRSYFPGLFESKDRECLMIFAPVSYLPNHNAEEVRVYELGKAMEMSIVGEPQAGLQNLGKLFHALEGDVWELKGSGYARKTFNADNVAEVWVDANFRFSGKDYVRKQVFIIEKDGKSSLIYCYYTNKGIANQDKYRKGIESVLKFH